MTFHWPIGETLVHLRHPLLQFGLPGGPEILIILLMLLMMMLPVALVVLIVLGVLHLTGSRGDDRVEELERRVDELQRELEAERATDDGPPPERDRDR